MPPSFHPDVMVHEPASLPNAGDWAGLDGDARLMRGLFGDMSVDGLACSVSPAG